MKQLGILLVVSGCLALLACGGTEERSPLAGGGEATAPWTGSASTDPCASPTEGCPCAPAATEVVCRVYRRSGDYVSCSVGKMSCIADSAGETGTYGPCEGAATVWDGGVH